MKFFTGLAITLYLCIMRCVNTEYIYFTLIVVFQASHLGLPITEVVFYKREVGVVCSLDVLRFNTAVMLEQVVLHPSSIHIK